MLDQYEYSGEFSGAFHLQIAENKSRMTMSSDRYRLNLTSADTLTPRLKNHLISLYDKNIYTGREKEFGASSLPFDVNKTLNNSAEYTPQRQRKSLRNDDGLIGRLRNKFEVDQDDLGKCCCAMRRLTLKDLKNNRSQTSTDVCCVSEHDRKIISRLAMKRVRQLADQERAEKAREIWDQERELRNQMMEQQTNEYKAQLQEKRTQEYKERKRREYQILKKRKRQEKELRYQLELKQAQLDEKLKELDYQKDVEMNKRRQEAQARSESNALKLQANRVQQTLKKCAIADELETKQLLADNRRQEVKKEYEQRVSSANKEWAHIRDCGLQIVRLREQNRLDLLRQSAAKKDERCDQVKRRRLLRYEQALEQARRSAEIRESVRTQTPETTRRQIKNLLNRHYIMTDDEFECFN